MKELNENSFTGVSMASQDATDALAVSDITNAIPHCPVMLVLDTSHSMWGQGLSDMMMSLKVFYTTIANEQFANAQVDVAAVSMGDNLCLLEDFTTLNASGLPNRNIRPKGDTPIGAALDLARQTIQTQIRRYQAAGISHVTPNLILLSDGKSTDDFSAAADGIRNEVKSGKLVCRAIALGNDADMTALQTIAGKDNVMLPSCGGMPQAFKQVGQIVSQTYEEEAQEVIVEQAVPVSRHEGTEYLIDGSNLLFIDEYRTGITLRYLLAVTDYLKREHQSFQVFFDATAPYKLRDFAPQEVAQYKDLLKNDPEHFQQVPAGTSADDFLLFQANTNRDALVLTNDCFRDYHGKYPWLRTEKRVIHGKVMNNVVFFPEISLQVSVKSTEKTVDGDL